MYTCMFRNTQLEMDVVFTLGACADGGPNLTRAHDPDGYLLL